MRSAVFAVCDPEAGYAYSFMNYVNQKKNMPFEVHAFTSVESLLLFAETEQIEVLLLAESFLCRKIREWKAGKVILLSEKGDTGEEEYPCVYKYQSSEKVIGKVLEYYASEQEDSGVLSVPKKRTELLGICSPVGRCGKTSFALALGQILAKEQTVLYLNLEPFSGLSEVFGADDAYTLSELLYYVRLKQKRLGYWISSMHRSVGGMDYIPPAGIPEDLVQVTEEEWLCLLDVLVHQTSYEVVILDLSAGIQGFFSLLSLCDKLYVPVLPDRLSENKIREMERGIQRAGREELLEKVNKIRLPLVSEAAAETDHAEQMVWNEMGDFVRSLQGKDRECRDLAH